MKPFYPFRRSLATFLLLIFVLSQMGCVFIQRYPMASSRLPKINTADLSFFLIDNDHPLSVAWEMKVDKIGPKNMVGKVTKVSQQDAHDIVTVQSDRDARYSYNEVLIFLKADYAAQLLDTASIDLQYDQIDRIEVYEANFGKTVSLNALAFSGIGLALVVLAFLAKGSCPFIYADNPNGMPLQGELYSGAVYPQLERHDWLALPGLVPNGGQYKIRIANKAKEIQHTNIMELMVIDHPEGVTPILDKYGHLHGITKLEAPLSASDYQGKDVLPFLQHADEHLWHGDEHNSAEKAEEGLILEWTSPPGAKMANLVVRAKNTFWMDFLYGQFLDEFGQYSQFVRKRYLDKSAAEIKAWMQAQNVPLSVWLENENGQWVKYDDFNLAGPMALKTDVLRIPVPDNPKGRFRIKLESGFQFWEIDQVGLSFSESNAMTVQSMKPLSAVSKEGLDVRDALMADDQQYYSQPKIQDEATVVFDIPTIQAGQQRSLVLHSKGHYEILRDPVTTDKSLLQLRRYLNPGALPLFSRERYWEMSESQAVVLR
jgi:hypothetical protein